MTTTQSRRTGLIWAAVGGAVLVVAIAAILVTSFAGRPAESTSSPTLISPAEPSPSASTTEGGGSPDETGYVDPTAADNGWIREPITRDIDTYVRAVLAAAGTFDTQRSSREDWLLHLDTWFTPDTRYASAQDREDQMRAARLEMRQAVVLPEVEWSSLAAERGRVESVVSGPIAYAAVPGDETGDMRFGTADVTMTFTREDGSGDEFTYDQVVRVTVQVLCGPDSVPTPDSAQQPGDCKLVRLLSGPVEH